MTWKIEIGGDALKQLKKIDKADAKRIFAYLRERVALRDNPRELGKPLTGELNELWRYRVGDYRIIARIEDAELVILVVRVGHRRHVYR